MPTEFSAQLRKLRLPEQDDLKNEAERCSADPATLSSIGRSIGQQVRIVRCDSPNFVAVYTVKQANPDADLGKSELANVVRTGESGRERLGKVEEMAARVLAKVVDDGPSQSGTFSFFELACDGGKRAYLIAIAPHGGEIEPGTDQQARDLAAELSAASFPASFWVCIGDGDRDKGASDRWHITSEDIQPACFPLLEPLAARVFCYGVSFHGFDQKEGEADVYIGGGASLPLKRAIEKAINDLSLALEVKISTGKDKAKFQGFSPENIINRLATRGVQLEQSRRARDSFGRQIALAVARVFTSRRRLQFCDFVQDLKARRAEAKIQLAESLSRDLAAGPLNIERAIAKHGAFRAKDKTLLAKIHAAVELETVIEEHIGEITSTPQDDSPMQVASKRRQSRERRTS